MCSAQASHQKRMNSRSWPIPHSSARRWPSGSPAAPSCSCSYSRQPRLVGLDLSRGQRRRVAAEEQLQRGRVAQFVEIARRLIAPALQRLAAALGQAVDSPAPARLLLALVEQALLGQPRALRVELRVRDRPEVVRAQLRELLEVIRRRGLALLEQARARCRRSRSDGRATALDMPVSSVRSVWSESNHSGGTIMASPSARPSHPADARLHDARAGDGARRAAAQRRAAELAERLAAAHRTGEVRGRRATHAPLVRRAGDAAPLHRRRTAACPTATATWRAAPTAPRSEQGRMVYGEFATDPCRSLFKRVQTLFSPGKTLPDNANINVTTWASATSR